MCVCRFLLDKYFCRGSKASIPVLTFEDIPQIKQEDFVARVSIEELASIKILAVLLGHSVFIGECYGNLSA